VSGSFVSHGPTCFSSGDRSTRLRLSTGSQAGSGRSTSCSLKQQKGRWLDENPYLPTRFQPERLPGLQRQLQAQVPVRAEKLGSDQGEARGNLPSLLAAHSQGRAHRTSQEAWMGSRGVLLDKRSNLGFPARSAVRNRPPQQRPCMRTLRNPLPLRFGSVLGREGQVGTATPYREGDWTVPRPSSSFFLLHVNRRELHSQLSRSDQVRVRHSILGSPASRRRPSRRHLSPAQGSSSVPQEVPDYAR
jgi:hypothetical protein